MTRRSNNSLRRRVRKSAGISLSIQRRRLFVEQLEDRRLLFAPLEISGVDVGAWQVIDTPGVDERSIEAVQGEEILFYHEAAQPATPTFGNFSHMWAQGGGGTGNDGQAITFKWFNEPGGASQGQYNGRPVTLIGSTVSDVNGQGYLKWTGFPEYYQLWRSYNGTPGVHPSDGTFSDPVTTTSTGYLGNGNGDLVDGHGPISAGSDDAVGRVTYTWDGNTLSLETPIAPTGLEFSYSEDVPGTTIATINHFWRPSHPSSGSTIRVSLTGKGQNDPPDGTKITFWDMEFNGGFASLNGQVAYTEWVSGLNFDLWADAGLSTPLDATEPSPDYHQYFNEGKLVDGVTTISSSGDVYRDPTILNNGSGNLEAYFSPADEDESDTATGLIHATSSDGGLTWTVDPVLNADILNGTVSLGEVSAPIAFGNFSHMWAQGGGGTGNDGQAITFKWFKEPGSGATYNGRPVTLLNSNVTDVNGQGYLKWTGFPEYYQLWGSYDGTTFSDPVTTTSTGYLGNSNGYLADGHVTQTFPGNGAVDVIEVGGERLLFAADKNGDHSLFTSAAGSNGPFTDEGMFIENGITGSPVITSVARSGDALVTTNGAQQIVKMYVDGNFNGAADNEANQGAIGFFAIDSFFDITYQIDDVVRIDDTSGGGTKNDPANNVPITFASSVSDAGMTALEEATLANVQFVGNKMTALLLITGAADSPSAWDEFGGQPDPRSSHDHDIFYAPITITFNQLVGPIDFGDAPDDGMTYFYRTLLDGGDVDAGARHGIVAGFHLGTDVDAETDGQPNADATGDDTLDSNDDEDGVAIATMARNRNSTVQVTVAGADMFGGTVKLDAWVDFNQDGDFDATTERITAAGGTDVVNGANNVTFAVPAGAVLGDTFARFRLSSVGGLAPDGEALDGEVEDHQVTVDDPPMIVYVDDDWSSYAPGTIVDADPGAGTINAEIGYDAFATIQHGVDQVAVAGTVNVLAGTYVGDVSVNKHGITLLGARAGVLAGPVADPAGRDVVNFTGESVIEGQVSYPSAGGVNQTTVDGFAVLSDGEHGFVLRGEGTTIVNNIINGGDGNLSNRGIFTISASDFDISNNNIRNYLSGIVFDGGPDDLPTLVDSNYITAVSAVGIGTFGSWANGSTFSHNVIEDSGGGINLAQGGHQVTENTFRNIADITGTGNSFYGTVFRFFPDSGHPRLFDVTISNNIVDGATRIVETFGPDLPETDNIVLTNNSFTGWTQSIRNSAWTKTIDTGGNWWGTTDPTAVATGMTGPVDFTPMLYNATDTSSDPGFQGDFSELIVHTLGSQLESGGRINEGIAKVDGSTVHVAAGTYNENVDVPPGTDGLNLLGANAGVSANPVHATTRGAETIINGNVQVGVPQGASNITFDGFTVNSGASDAVAVRGPGMTVSNNILEGLMIFPTSGTASGVRISDSAPVGPGLSFDFENNYISGYRYGMLLDGSAARYDASGVSSTASGNYITNNQRAIQSFGDLHGGTIVHEISDNTITGNDRGIRLAAGQFTISGNDISNNTQFGIEAGVSSIVLDDLTLESNVITGTGSGNGIILLSQVDPDSSVTIRDMTISGYDNGGTITNVATVNWETTDNDDTVFVNGADSELSASGVKTIDPISFTGMTTLNLDSLDGEDAVTVSPHDSTVFNLDGNIPNVPLDMGENGDTLIYVSDGINAFNIGGSVITTATKTDINHTNFENIEVSGDLVLDGTGDDDTLEITATGPTSGSYVLTSGGVSAPAVALSNITSLTFNGLEGHDILRINNPGGGVFAPSGGIIFNGGPNSTTSGQNPGGDRLEILGGSATSVVYTPHFGSGDTARGKIESDSQVITFTGLEPALVTTSATTVTIDLSSLAAGETVTILDDGDDGNGISRVDFNDSTLEDLDFANPSGELIILADGNAGADTINIQAVDSLFDADLTITGGATDDVDFTGSINFGDNDLTVTAARTITVGSGVALETTVDGAIDLTASRNIVLETGSSLATVDGGVTLLANDGGSTPGNFLGISLDNAAVSTSGEGAISLTGTGGDSVASNNGVDLQNGAQILSTGTGAGAGTITITGTGGTTGTFNKGVFMEDSNTLVSSIDGAIEINGFGGMVAASGGGEIGVQIRNDAKVESTGTGAHAATITINGTGGTTNGPNYGISIAAATVTSIDGNISLTGDGGTGTTNQTGVSIASSGIVESTGTGASAATITIVGTGGTGTTDAHGVEVTGSGAKVTSADGDIDITGTGGGSGSDNYGVLLTSSGQIEATGAGSISISGDGINDEGVRLDSNVVSDTGTVDIISEDDVVFTANGLITSTSGAVSVTADNAAGNNGGVITMDPNAMISTGTGDIDLSADGDITLAGVSGNHVAADSNSGSIIEAGDMTSEITAATAILTAAGSVGASGAGNWLDTEVDNLEGRAGAGGFFVWNTGDLEVGNIGTTEGIANDGVSTTGGDLEIYVLMGNLTVSETIDSNRNGTTGGGDIKLETGVAIVGGDIHVNAMVLSAGGMVDVLADNDITFAATGKIDVETGGATVTLLADQDATDGGGIDMTDGSTVNARGGTIDVDAEDNIRLSNLTTLGGDVTVDSTSGSILDNGDTDKEIHAATAVLQASDSVGTSGNPLETQLANLEGVADSGFFLDNMGDLTIGQIGPVNGVSSECGTVVLRNMGRIDVREDVTAEVDIEIVSLQLAGAQPITVFAGAVVDAGQDVFLRSSDDLDLQDSSTVLAGNQIHLFGDTLDDAPTNSVDPDADGATINLFGTLSASGTSGNIFVNGNADNDVINVNPGDGHTAEGLTLDGKAGDDEYHLWFGRLDGGNDAVLIDDTGGGTDRATVFGTEANEEFNVVNSPDADGSSGGFAEVSAPKAERVNYTGTLEFLTVRGENGTDTFNVQPSQATEITINGNNPGFGDANGPGGDPNGPGDVLEFDALGNAFAVVGKSLRTDGNGNFVFTDAADFEPVNFVNLENVPLQPFPSDQSPLRFDFDAGTNVTQSGFTQVLQGRLYGGGSSGSDFGWVGTAPAGFERPTALTSVFTDLLRDTHSDSVARTFRADVANGWYVISIKSGDRMLSFDGLRVANADNGQVLLDGIGSAVSQFSNATFAVQVTDGTLDLTFSDETGTVKNWAINGIEIWPTRADTDNPFLSMGSPNSGPLVADGVSQTTFQGFDATPNSLITIMAGVDTTGDNLPDVGLAVLSTDQDADLAGVQVLADGDGQFSYTIRHSSARGTMFVNMEEVTGQHTGCLAVDMIAPTVRRFDFNGTSSSPTQAPVAGFPDNPPTVETDGYVAVLPGNLQNATVGYGWLGSAVQSFDRNPLPGVQGELRQDGHISQTARTFQFELQPGTYLVNVTIGDKSRGVDNMSITANGTPINNNVNTAVNRWTNLSFNTSVGASGLLDLTFADNGGVDTYWTVNGIEAFLLADLAPVVFTAEPGVPLPADGTTVDTIDGTIGGAGVADGTLLTVSTTLGTITSTDASANYAGHQVVVNSNAFSFDVQRPTGGGTPTLSAVAVNGVAAGSVTDANTLSYAGLPTRLFDFNSGSSPTQTPTQPPTSGGYVGVQPGALFSSSTGFGWLGSAVSSFDRGPQAGTQGDLRRDGHLSSSDRTFQVNLTNGTYAVNATIGDASQQRDNVQILNADDSSALLFTANTTAGQWQHGMFDVTVNDGTLNLQMHDNGGPDVSWALNGLEIRPVGELVNVTFAGPGEVDADGTTVSTVSGMATGVPDGTLLTITTSLGTITSADASSQYKGHQVAVNSGTFSFDVQSPLTVGTPTLTATAVNGSARGTVNDANELDFIAQAPTNSEFRFDFNGPAGPSASSPTAAGFIGVRGSSLFNGQYGWQTSVGDFSRMPLNTSKMTDDLYVDGIIQSTFPPVPKTFSIAVPNGTYDVRAYTGDRTAFHFGLTVTAEQGTGNQKFAAGPNTGSNFFTTVTLMNVTVDDGMLDITFSSTLYNYVVNGLEIATAGNLPTTAPLMTSPLPTTAATDNPSSFTQTSSTLPPHALSSVVESAIGLWEASGALSAEQLSRVRSAEVQIADLSSHGALGLAGSRQVLIDGDAAGLGWHIDLTSSSLSGVPSDRYDLLTVVAHELGHLAGLSDLDPRFAPDSLMAGTLTPGIRRLPTGIWGTTLASVSTPAMFSVTWPQSLEADRFSAIDGASPTPLANAPLADDPLQLPVWQRTPVAIASPRLSASASALDTLFGRVEAADWRSPLLDRDWYEPLGFAWRVDRLDRGSVAARQADRNTDETDTDKLPWDAIDPHRQPDGDRDKTRDILAILTERRPRRESDADVDALFTEMGAEGQAEGENPNAGSGK